MSDTARIHSIETLGTVDGPGIRYIIFFQGCPLRCKYCHNPDTWDIKKGNIYTLDKLFSDIEKYTGYMKYSGGGITASGGEPLLQTDFCLKLFKKCRKNGINTALDTSGNIFSDKQKELLKYTDLVLLDIKAFNPETFKSLTGRELNPTLEFEEYINKENIPVWIRFVLVPGLTDNEDDIKKMAEYLSSLSNVKRVDVLPFHKMGEYKWKELRYEYVLYDTKAPTAYAVKSVKNIFSSFGLYAP